jgi:hypothetical protein
VNAGSIEVTGSHERGCEVPAWVDGRSAARVSWRGIPDGEQHGRTVTSVRELLVLLGSIDAYEYLELVSAKLIQPRQAS